jgi:transposase
MVHGARSALRTAKSKDDRPSQWVVRLAEQSHANVAAIALANKTARMAWAMLRNGTDYQPERAAACPTNQQRSTREVSRSVRWQA